MHTSNRPDSSEIVDDEPLVGVPSHPAAALVGAVLAGGATGAVVGTAAGPIGTAVGAIAGAVAGALGGDAIASSFSEASDDEHWRAQYSSRPYVTPGSSYDDYGPAYAFGDDARRRYSDANFDDLDAELGSSWQQGRGSSKLEWEQAKLAARDAWDRGADKSGASIR